MRIISLGHSSAASSIFDLLRWGAAFYVVIFHLRPVLFVGSHSIPSGEVFIKLVYGFTSLGYQFVMLFFVLSGFLIGSTVLKKILDGTWSWRDYLIKRFTRLWIVLIPALGLTWLLARAELAVFHNASTFSGSMTWNSALGNLFFLQGVMVPNFAQNLPLWSLAYEFWYYMMFPCLIFTLVSKKWFVRIINALVLGVLLFFLRRSIDLYFLIWLLGVAIALLPSPSHHMSRRQVHGLLILTAGIVAPAALVLGKVYVSRYHVPNFDMLRAFPADFGVALVFGIGLYLLLHLYKDVQMNRQLGAVSTRLAGFSYTLYLTHYPLINLLRRWLGNGTWGVWEPNTYRLLVALVILLGILFYAWLVAALTEARTAQLRSLLFRRIELRPGKLERPTVSGLQDR